MMTEATELRTSCTQKAIQPYRRQALAAVLRFCLATSVTGSSVGVSGPGAATILASDELADGVVVISLGEGCSIEKKEDEKGRGETGVSIKISVPEIPQAHILH